MEMREHFRPSEQEMTISYFQIYGPLLVTSPLKGDISSLVKKKLRSSLLLITKADTFGLTLYKHLITKSNSTEFIQIILYISRKKSSYVISTLTPYVFFLILLLFAPKTNKYTKHPGKIHTHEQKKLLKSYKISRIISNPGAKIPIILLKISNPN